MLIKKLIILMLIKKISNNTNDEDFMRILEICLIIN